MSCRRHWPRHTTHIWMTSSRKSMRIANPLVHRGDERLSVGGRVDQADPGASVLTSLGGSRQIRITECLKIMFNRLLQEQRRDGIAP